MSEEGQLQDYSVDQLAGAVVLVLGAIAGLLQVIWMSKCHCKVNLCYIFRCERRPPTEEEMKTLKDKTKELKNKKNNKNVKKTESKEQQTSSPEPEPEIEIEKLV
jgi:flagellar biosynthesis component FlhA